MPTHGARAASSRLPPSARPRTPSRDMLAIWRVAAVCLLAGTAPLACAVQVTVVCADLVGAGGVGIRVWPTLKASPERHSKTMHFRLLQINWEAERLLEGDWVGVFEDDPRPPHLRPLPTPLPPTSNRDWRAPQPLFWDTPFATLGTITSNYSQPRVEVSVLARGGCVGPYVGFVRNGVCVAADCMSSHPTWLYDHRAVLGSRSLRSLVLPGTHNAGSYSLADDDDVVASWVVCQDEDIISQLLYGNRYLDLRVGYYPETQELLWVNHDLVRWRPLQDVLDSVRGFLAFSPDPLIIDIHRTPVGFKLPGAMELLLSLMNTTLGSHFVHNRHGPHVTLDDLWQMGKRVVFTFIDPAVSDHTPWVWPPLPQAWANAQLLDDLRTFLDAEMNKRFESPRLWAAMAHLTPTLWDLLFRSHIGVRGLADRVNFSITRWLRQRWGHMANIVASDFFNGNALINVAIRTNLALSMCRPSDPSRHPYTLRWTTELALRPGSPSTTIPPFVRRMYSGGALWSTTSVRQIHYPFIPVDANISMVFTAIPNRIPSVAPGVTYQDIADTWREIFHYPTDGSPQPPEASAPHPDTQPGSSTTPSPVTEEASPHASVEAVMAEWGDVDDQHFLDEAFSGLRNSAPASATHPSGLHGTKILHPRPLPSEKPTRPTFWPRDDDATESPVITGGVNRVDAPVPLPRDLGNADFDSDAFHTSSLPSTSNAALHQEQAAALEHDSLIPSGGDTLEDKSVRLTTNIQQDNDSLTFNNHSLAATNDTQDSSLSIMITPSQDSYFLTSVDATLQNSSLQSISNATLDGSPWLVTDDDNGTSHSPPDQENISMVGPTRMVTFKQRQRGVQEVRYSDAASPGSERINSLNGNDSLFPHRHQASKDSTEQLQATEPSTEQVDAYTITTRSHSPQVEAHAGSPAVTTARAPPGAPIVTVRPTTPTLRTPPGASTVSVQPTTPTEQVQRGEATITAHLGAFDLTATRSSSKVT